MSEFAKPRSRNIDPLSVLPAYQAECSCSGCNEPTTVVMLQVRDGDGRTRTGPAHDFCMPRKTDKPDVILRGEYFFLRWITRCAECYYLDVEKVGKGQLCGLKRPNHDYMLNKPHDEKMIVLRNLIRGCVKKVSPPEKQDYEEAI